MRYLPLIKVFHENQEDSRALYERRFSDLCTFHLDIEIGGYAAFFCLTPEIVSSLIKIYKMDKGVQKLRDRLPDAAIDQFAKRCLIDEIVLTNNIEGVNSTRRDIENVLNDLRKKDPRKRFVGLVQKYQALQRKETLSLKTCADIRAVYDDLFLSEIQENDPENVPDGEIFRKGPVSVMSPTGREIHRGLFPEEKIRICMEKTLEFTQDSDCEMLIRISVLHYLLGYIHPFYDGNGRLSRFISSYLLSHELDPLIGYRISYTIKQNIKEYYGAFKICNDPRNFGDLTPFVSMFTTIIRQSMEQLQEALRKRHMRLNEYAKKIRGIPCLQSGKLDQLCFLLVQAQLFSEQGIPTRDLLSELDFSRTTLSKRLGVFEDMELLLSRKVGREWFYGIRLEELDALAASSCSQIDG